MTVLPLLLYCTGTARIEEVEEQKKRLAAKLSEVEQELETALNKISQLEKVKQRLLAEHEDLQADLERASGAAGQFEKKQKQLDRVVAEWQHKCQDLNTELENAQRDGRNATAEVFRLRGSIEEYAESIESLKRENKNLSGASQRSRDT